MRKSTALMVAVAVVLGLLIVGAVGEDGNGMLVGGGGCCCCCCFFAVVRFFVDDGILRETSDFKNSWGRSKTRGDTIRSDSGLGLDLERLGTRWWGHRTTTQGIGAETQGRGRRDVDANENRREEPTGLLKGLEKVQDVTSRTGDVAVRLERNADSGGVKHAFKGRIKPSSPRWSRPRCPELVAGSGKHVGMMICAMDEHGNLSTKGHVTRRAAHPITAVDGILFTIIGLI